jgi:hypothetical protein
MAISFSNHWKKHEECIHISAVVEKAPRRRHRNVRGSTYEPQKIEVTFSRSNGREWSITQIAISGPLVRSDGNLGHAKTKESWFENMAGIPVENMTGIPVWVLRFLTENDPTHKDVDA